MSKDIKNTVCNIYTIVVEFNFETSGDKDRRRKAILRAMSKLNATKKSAKVYTVDCHKSEIERVIKVIDEISEAYQLVSVVRIINYNIWCRVRYKYKGGVEFIGAESLADLIK